MHHSQTAPGSAISSDFPVAMSSILTFCLSPYEANSVPKGSIGSAYTKAAINKKPKTIIERILETLEKLS